MLCTPCTLYVNVLSCTLRYTTVPILKSRCAVSCLRVRKVKVVVCTVPTATALLYRSVASTPFIRLHSCNLLQLAATALHHHHHQDRISRSTPTSSRPQQHNNTDVFERHIHSFLLLRVLVIGSCPCSHCTYRPPVERPFFLIVPSSDCCLLSIYVSSHSSPTTKTILSGHQHH